MIPSTGTLGLVEQVDRAGRVDQRQVLRRRDDHRARPASPAGSATVARRRCRRQVDDQQFGIAPVGVDQLRQRSRRHRPAPGERVARPKPAGPATGNARRAPATGISWSPSAVGLTSLPSRCGLRRAVDVGVDQPDLSCRCGRARWRDWRRRVDLPTPPLPLPIAISLRPGLLRGHRHRALRSTPGSAQRGGAELALERVARSASSRPVASTTSEAIAADQLARADSGRVGQGVEAAQRIVGFGHRRRHRSSRAACHCFSPRTLPIVGSMNIFSGLGARARGLFSDNKGPWGPSGGGGDEPPSDDGRRRAVGRAAQARAPGGPATPPEAPRRSRNS